MPWKILTQPHKYSNEKSGCHDNRQNNETKWSIIFYSFLNIGQAFEMVAEIRKKVLYWNLEDLFDSKESHGSECLINPSDILSRAQEVKFKTREWG